MQFYFHFQRVFQETVSAGRAKRASVREIYVALTSEARTKFNQSTANNHKREPINSRKVNRSRKEKSKVDRS